ncbi:MAG: hypothetical protein IJA69_01705 [Clostridia bacterium]|nr:hypothetical protein [Clostridia bacterium]
MKKSVIVIIGLIYIASIVFISFFGMKMLSYDETVYSESVQVLNEDMIDKVDDVTNKNFKIVQLKYEDGLTYTIRTKVYPENVSNKAVECVYDQERVEVSIETDIVTVKVLPFSNRSVTITLTIRPADGTNQSTEVRLFVKK